MRAIVVRDPTPLPPFGAPARDAWFLDTTLGAAMERTLAAAGLAVTTVDSLEAAEAFARDAKDGAVLVRDSVVFSPQVLAEFLRIAKAEPGPDVAIRCALPRGIAIDKLSHIEGLDAVTVAGQAAWTADLFFLRGRANLADASPRLVSYKESVTRRPLHKALSPSGELAYAISEGYLCNVRHWQHVLRMNLAAIVTPWATRRQMGGGVLGLLWYLWRLFLAFPWVGGRVAEAMRIVGRGANVHRTAHIEATVIGKGAHIGARAIVKFSYIGEGAHIDDGAHVIGAVIAPGAIVGRTAVVVGCVLYPGSMAAQQMMQLSILGHDAIALTTSTFFDVNLSGNVRVAYKGRFLDCGQNGLGVCVGPRATIGGGVWIASGREVPPDAFIVKDPAEVAHRLASLHSTPSSRPYVADNGNQIQSHPPCDGVPAATAPMIVRDGKLVPLSRR